MKRVLIAIFLMGLTMALQAKENGSNENKTDSKTEATMVFSGLVADEKSGESLVGVEVKLEGTDLKTYTDFDGKFCFEGIKPGEYKVVANYISYQKKSEVLEITFQKNEVKINLQSSN